MSLLFVELAADIDFFVEDTDDFDRPVQLYDVEDEV